MTGFFYFIELIKTITKDRYWLTFEFIYYLFTHSVILFINSILNTHLFRLSYFTFNYLLMHVFVQGADVSTCVPDSSSMVTLDPALNSLYVIDRHGLLDENGFSHIDVYGAQQICQLKCMHLVAINSDIEQDKIKAAVSAKSKASQIFTFLRTG